MHVRQSTLFRLFLIVGLLSALFLSQLSAFSADDLARTGAPAAAPLGTEEPSAPASFGTGSGDTRINRGQGDHIAASYITRDADGQPVLEIWVLDDSGNGVPLLVINTAAYADYITNPPAENTLIASEANVAVYILTTGELQVNITEPGTGKVFVTIYDLRTLRQVGGYLIIP